MNKKLVFKRLLLKVKWAMILAILVTPLMRVAAQPLVDLFPGPLLTTSHPWASWQSNLMFNYTPLTASAGTQVGNQWYWSDGTSLIPAAPAPYTAGGMLKFNFRNSAFTPGGAVDTGCAYIASAPLDFSARGNAAASVSFWMYHDYYQTNGLDIRSKSQADSVVVYINSTDQLAGAVRLGAVWADTVGFGVGSAWRQSTLPIPLGMPFDSCQTLRVLLVGYTWTSYRNMYVDNVTISYFPSAKKHVLSLLNSQNTFNVGTGTLNNEIVGVKINVCGSSGSMKLDSIYFLPVGTNIVVDVDSAKLYYTGNSPSFATSSKVFTSTAVIANVGPYTGLGNTAAGIQLLPGDNYFWLAYDIKSSGWPGDIVDADFVGLVLDSAGTKIKYGTPSSLAGSRLIGINYTYPTYYVGTSFAGYTINDFISSVAVTSAAGNPLFNQEHDITTWAGCYGGPGQNCTRHSPHPPDYTFFPANNMGATKDRSLNLKLGQGIRTGTTADKISIAAGTWFGGNYVRAWVDFNSDGDFSDIYVVGPDTVFESIHKLAYPLSDNQAIGSLGSVPAAFPLAKKGDDWEEWNVHVPSLGELPVVGGGSGGPPVKVGTVRMRVREVWATNSFTPTNTHTFGEVEDYDVALVDNCPAPGSKYCKWLGGGVNPTDWFTSANWCPGIPGPLDTALISPNGQGYYPIITSNQNPQCATLRIFSPATVTVNAPDILVGSSLSANTGIMKIYHNMEIGEAQNTAAQFNVVTSLDDTAYTGVASANGNTVISPLRNDKQDHKIQMIYTPTDLSVMGIKNGDLLKSLTWYVKPTTTTAIAAGSLGSFSIKIWQLDSPYAYPLTLTAMTEVAVNNTAPGILPAVGSISSTQVYGPATLNLPIIAGSPTVTPVTINFSTRHLVDATKYLVIEVSRDAPFVAGAAYPVLYESTIPRSCLSLFNVNTNGTAATTAASITGPGNGVGAVGINLANGILNNGTGASGGTGLPYAHIAGTTYVFRPFATIGVTRQFTKYNIEVGGNWINNNQSGPPLGFNAGWSRVKFLNNYVPGVHNWNSTDTISGTEITTFNEAEINDANGMYLKVQGIGSGNLGVEIDSSLVLTNGLLNLNQHRLHIDNPLPWGIQRTNGVVLSENVNNFNKISWNVATNTAAHVVPFGVSTAAPDYVPMTFTVVSGDVGTVTMSTYRTNNANAPVPVQPVAVNNMFNSSCVDNSANVIDRFWQIDRSTGGAISANVTFAYTASENTTGYTFSNLVAQRYDASAAKACGLPSGRWSNPTGIGQSATSQTTSNSPVLSVTANGVTNFSPWAIAGAPTPLPLELVNFDAKLINDKVKIFWTVANETNVNKYEVFKSFDKQSFNFMGMKNATGPSVGNITNYELWDAQPLQGIQYYQLKTVHNSGAENLSAIVPVAFKAKSFGIVNTYINDNGQTAVNFVTDVDGLVVIRIIDMYGRELLVQPTVARNGSNVVTLNVELSKGSYIISIDNGTLRDASQLVN